MRVAILATIAAAVLSLLTALPAAAADVVARGTWSMVPQSKDSNGDGFIDGDGGVPARGAMSRFPSPEFVGAGNRIAQPHERLIDGSLSWYLDDRGFPVRLDACRSRGAEYRWIVRRPGAEVTRTPWRDLSRRTCRQVVTLPEGDYDLILEVRGGGAADRSTLPATVRNILVVALGDSYASGEGNPRNVRAWLRQPGSFTAYWDDDACHRSARSAPAQAALRAEQASSRTSVTFVDVSCSGATVDQGLLGPQTSADQDSSQVEQVLAIVGSREVDAVTVSIGGNDVGFTSILQTCAVRRDCPLSRATAPPLSRYPNVQAGVQAETAALTEHLATVASCLGGDSCTLADGRVIESLRLSPQARVLPTLYPDLTRAASGGICSYLTISATDFGWARDTILVPDPAAPYAYPTSSGSTVRLPLPAGSLNQVLDSTARFGTWTPVTGTWARSGESAIGHGVCAGSEAWVYGATVLQGFSSASFHPNVPGTRELGEALAQALVALTDP